MNEYADDSLVLQWATTLYVKWNCPDNGLRVMLHAYLAKLKPPSVVNNITMMANNPIKFKKVLQSSIFNCCLGIYLDSVSFVPCCWFPFLFSLSQSSFFSHSAIFFSFSLFTSLFMFNYLKILPSLSPSLNFQAW